MRKLTGAVVMAILLMSAAACKREKQDTTHEEASRLYSGICSATRLYTDSILAASDTTQVNLLIEHFEERLEAINYDALPDTDYNLSEGQNDTIFQLLSALTEARVKRLKELGVHNPAPLDSILVAADSVSNQ